MLNNRLRNWVGVGASLLFVLFTLGCGDGKKCDCCKKRSDCEFGLQCVDLAGGTGKVCGEAGINVCSVDACAGSSTGLLYGRPTVSSEENNGTYAVSDALADAVKNVVEDEEVVDGGLSQ